ncbi:MAG: hypothetical protein AAGH15_12380 [Myxococcota bacterium]
MWCDRTGRALGLAAACVLALAAPAHATPPDVFGFGPRTSAMGMTGTAYARDYEAVWANPAGLAQARVTGLSLGYVGGQYRLRLDGQDPAAAYRAYGIPDDVAPGAFHAATIGFHLPLPFGGALEDVFVLGAGFYTPRSTVLQTDVFFAEVPQFPVVNRVGAVHVHLALGIDLGRWVPGLRLGFGASALARLSGTLDVFLDEADQFVSLTETQVLSVFNPTVGAQLDLGEDWTLGVVFRDRVAANIDIDIEVTNLPVEIPRITVAALPQYDPHTLAAELAYRPTRCLLLAAHLSYRFWSDYPGVLSRATDFSNQPPRPEFSDTISPRVGVEWSLGAPRFGGALRAGYAYEPTPAPPARSAPALDAEGNVRIDEGSALTTPLRYVDADRHVLSGGGGLHWATELGLDVRVDAFVQAQRWAARRHAIALLDAPDAPNLRSDGWILVGGLALTVEYR